MRSATLIKQLSAPLLLLACLSTAAYAGAPSHITVGTLYASSGPFASISMPVYKGLKLWVKTVNADGGAYVKQFDKKIPIKLVSYDDQSSTSTAGTLYNQLITEDHVDILVSDSGSVLTSVAVPIAQEHKMFLFDQTGTSTHFFHHNQYIALLDDPMTSLWPKRLTEFLKEDAEKHGIKRIAILYSTNDFTAPQAESLRNAIKDEKGLKVVYYHGVPTKTSSYTVLIHRIKSDNPDAVIELGYPNNDIDFLGNLDSSGVHFSFIFTVYPGLETDLMMKNLGGQVLRGNFTYVPATGLNYHVNYGMNLKAFTKAYVQQYGKGSNVGFNAVAGYNTGLIIQKALATAKSLKQPALRKAVFAQSGKLDTLDGDFKLNKNGAQIGEIMPIGQLQARNGSVQLEPVFPSTVARASVNWHAASH